MRLLMSIPLAVPLTFFALTLAAPKMVPQQPPQPAVSRDAERSEDEPPPPAPLLTQEKLAEYVAKVGKDSQAAAREGLAQFEELMTEANFANYGFESLAEVKKIQLGHPLPLVMVRLDELKKYQAGDDPFKLLHPLNKVVYPVLVNGKVRSGLALEEDNGTWAPTTFGISSSIRLYSQARERHVGRPNDGDYFLLKVMSLNHVYMGHRTDKDLRLVRVRDQAAAEHKLEGLPATRLFVELSKLAKEHDGAPRADEGS